MKMCRSMYLYVGIGLFLLCCLCVVASAAAPTYTASTHRITFTTSTSGFHNVMYNADKNGTLDLRSSTITGNDTNPVAHTYGFAPADYLVLGGAANDFYVNVTLWDATLVNLTVRIYGTNYFGVSQQEDILFTGNGQQYTTLQYRTSNSSKVIKFYKTTGTAPSVSVKVRQGQWGRMWRYSNNTYYVNDSYVYSGTAGIWLNESNVSVSWNVYDTTTDYAYYIASGNINFTKCSFVNLKPGTIRFIYALTSSSSTILSNCTFRNDAPLNLGVNAALLYIGNGYEKIENCMYINGFDMYFTTRNSVFRRNTAVRCFTGYATGSGTTGTPVVEDQVFNDCRFGFKISAANPFFIFNSTVVDCDYFFNWSMSGAGATLKYIGNVQTNTMQIQRVSPGTTSKALYMFGTVFNVSDGKTPISGVYVNISEINISSGATKITHCLTTDANGRTGYKWVNRSIYTSVSNYPSSNYSMNVSFEKAGYIKEYLSMTLSDELWCYVVLRPNPTLTVTEDLVGCAGTFEYAWVPGLLKFLGWANYTGTGGGSGGLQVVNPNPANSTTIYDSNFLQARSSGLGTSIDISGNSNFTVLSEANLGTGKRYENISGPVNGYNVILTGNGYYQLQTITIGTVSDNENFVVNKLQLPLHLQDVGGINGSIYFYILSNWSLISPIVVSSGTLDSSTLSPVYNWETIDMSPCVLKKNTQYAIMFSCGSITNRVYWKGETANVYAGGNSIITNFLDYYVETSVPEMWLNVTGWSLGGNISWDHTLNQTWSSNSSGAWLPYAHTIAVSNGTQSVLNTNFSDNDTVYYYRVATSNSSGVELSNITVTFTTAQRKQIIPISTSHGGSSSPMSFLASGGVFGGLFGCLFAVYMIRRKRKQYVVGDL